MHGSPRAEFGRMGRGIQDHLQSPALPPFACDDRFVFTRFPVMRVTQYCGLCKAWDVGIRYRLQKMANLNEIALVPEAMMTARSSCEACGRAHTSSRSPTIYP